MLGLGPDEDGGSDGGSGARCIWRIRCVWGQMSMEDEMVCLGPDVGIRWLVCEERVVSLGPDGGTDKLSWV